MLTNLWYFKNEKTGKVIDCVEAETLVEKIAKEYETDYDEYENYVEEGLWHHPEYWEYYKGHEDELFEMNDDAPFWSEWRSDCYKKAEQEFDNGWIDMDEM